MNSQYLSSNMSAVNTRLLVSGYVKYRLDKQQMPWDGCPTLPEPGKLENTIRALGDEFDDRYREVFDEMVNQLHITPNTANPTFVAIVNELFSDGVKWGRVVALFAFGGAAAVQCVQREMPDLVELIILWVSHYVDNQLMSWIQEHGGWDGLVEFYESGPENREETKWPSFKTICSYAAGAVGVLALGAVFTQRS